MQTGSTTEVGSMKPHAGLLRGGPSKRRECSAACRPANNSRYRQETLPPKQRTPLEKNSAEVHFVVQTPVARDSVLIPEESRPG